MILGTRNEGGKGLGGHSTGTRAVVLARFVRTALVPLVLAAVPIAWVAEATRRAALTPLGRDQGIFQYVAWALARGEVDYRDVRDVNGPLTHWIHLAFLAAGGADARRFRVLDLALSFFVFAAVGACLPGLARATQRSPAWLERAAWAIAGAVVLGAQYLLYSFWDLAQRESFFDWFLLASLGIQLRAQAARPGPGVERRAARSFAIAGALSVIPWFGKPTYVFFTLAQTCALVADRDQALARPKAAAAMAKGAALGFALSLALLAARGDVGSFVRIQWVDVPRMYRFIWPRSLGDLFSLPRIASPAAIGLTGTGALLALIALGEMPVRTLAVALVPVCALGSLILQAKGFPYHLHPLTAGAALQQLLVTCWLAERCRVAARKRALLRLVPVAAAAVLSLEVALSLRDSPHLQASFLAYDWSAALAADSPAYLERFNQTDFFPYEMKETADYLAANTPPEGRVQAYGMDPYVLFQARRLSATPYIYAYDLDADAALAGGSGARPNAAQARAIVALRDAHEADLLARLKTRPPAAFVFLDDAPTLARADAWVDFVEHCPVTAAWVADRYRETARFGHDHVWLRDDLSEAGDDVRPAPAAP